MRIAGFPVIWELVTGVTFFFVNLFWKWCPPHMKHDPGFFEDLTSLITGALGVSKSTLEQSLALS